MWSRRLRTASESQGVVPQKKGGSALPSRPTGGSARRAMNRRFQLKHLVLHYIGMRPVTPKAPGEPASEKWRRKSDKLQEIPALDEAIVDHLLALVEDVWVHADASGVHSARFEPEPKDPDRKKLRRCLKELKEKVWEAPEEDTQAPQEFLRLSRAIDDRLFDCTPLTASPGLLMVADVAYVGTGERHLALLKIRHSDERFVTILQESLTDLQVQDVEMMLTTEILKGMIWPHPSRPDYDLKLIDHQAKNRPKPADYFALEFLGCEAKVTDVRQAAELPDTLPRNLAKQHHLQLDADQTDDFVVELIERTAPTAEVVANLASRTGLIRDVPPAELQETVEQRLQADLPDILSAAQLEPDLRDIASERGWTYDHRQYREFHHEMDHALRLDEGKVTDALVKTGLLKDAETGPLLKSLEEAGGLDIPRETLIMRTKTKRRLLTYHFRVSRWPNSQETEEVTISGPPETLVRFLNKKDGGNYVFTIQTTPAGFRMEYK